MCVSILALVLTLSSPSSGIPLLYFVVLYQRSDQVNPAVELEGVDGRDPQYIEAQVKIRNANPAIQHLKFLYEPYEGQYWWWESAECVR